MPADARSVARYRRKLDALVKRGDRLDASAAADLVRLLDDARREVKDILSEVPTEWRSAHYGVVMERIGGALDEWRAKAGAVLLDGVTERWADGAVLTDAMLAEFGGEAELRGVPLDRRTLATLQGFSADLIQGLSDEVVADIGQRIRLGMLAGKTPFDVMKDVAPRLRDEDGNPAPSVFGDVMTRAETQVRTEMGRAFSVAQQGRLEQWDERDRGLLKGWLAVVDSRTRPSHVRAGREYGRAGDPGPIPVADPFVLRVGSDEASKGLAPGEYELMYPIDPGAPVALTANCRCQSFPWRAAWGGNAPLVEAVRRVVVDMLESEASRP